MSFPMKGWVTKKKRSKRKERSKCLIYKLPQELLTNILNRLSVKEISTTMCVSYQMREQILQTCSPTMPDMKSPLTVYVFPTCFQGVNRLFMWCYKVMRCRVTPQKLIDSCNGLLLFCHKDGEAENLTIGAYHYYVINFVTKQCVAVVKPAGIAGSSSPMYSFAALAYDPDESWFFKIVRFQGCRHINVFSSETGGWTTLTLKLPQEVNNAVWEKKTVYGRGGVYRLSRSGHMIRFLVDLQETVEKQAEVIKLPCTLQELDNYYWDIGEKNLEIMFTLATGESVTIWKLDESIRVGGVYSYQWTEIHKTIHLDLRLLISSGQFLSYHPYHGIALFKRNNTIYFHNCVQNTEGPRELRYQHSVYSYLNGCGLPLLQCSMPFACSLVKKHSRIFQRLPIPEN